MPNLIEQIFDKSMPGLHKSLDLNRKRTEAITSNIANAETPGYQAVDVNFAQELEKAFGHQNQKVMRTHPNHMDLLKDSSSSYLVQDLSGATKGDGNNVDIDLQMAKLAAAAGKYGKASALIRKKLQVLRMAIRRARM